MCTSASGSHGPDASVSEAKSSATQGQLFIHKLFALLEQPRAPHLLSWTESGDAFRVTSDDALALEALNPPFRFNRLNSFIRQLSYYGFKRLTDRRRSGERSAAHAAYIVFTHPSGLFVRGNAADLDTIARNRKLRHSSPPLEGRARRDSMSSLSATSAENDDGFTARMPPVPRTFLWAAPEGSATQPQAIRDRSSIRGQMPPSPSQYDSRFTVQPSPLELAGAPSQMFPSSWPPPTGPQRPVVSRPSGLPQHTGTEAMVPAEPGWAAPAPSLPTPEWLHHESRPPPFAPHTFDASLYHDMQHVEQSFHAFPTPAASRHATPSISGQPAATSAAWWSATESAAPMGGPPYMRPQSRHSATTHSVFHHSLGGHVADVTANGAASSHPAWSQTAPGGMTTLYHTDVAVSATHVERQSLTPRPIQDPRAWLATTSSMAGQTHHTLCQPPQTSPITQSSQAQTFIEGTDVRSSRLPGDPPPRSQMQRWPGT